MKKIDRALKHVKKYRTLYAKGLAFFIFFLIFCPGFFALLLAGIIGTFCVHILCNIYNNR